MPFTTHPLAAPLIDKTQLPALLEVFEGNVREVYDDGKHLATIGIGFNLAGNTNTLRLVLHYLGVLNDTLRCPRTPSLLQSLARSATRGIRAYSRAMACAMLTLVCAMPALWSDFAYAASKPRWHLIEGKGDALCETLLKIANGSPPIVETRTPGVPWALPYTLEPNMPWPQVLAIKGVREPDWEDLDPAKHEDLFLKAKDAFDAENRKTSPGYKYFEQWFEPAVGKSLGRASMNSSYQGARLSATEIYRGFVQRGGKLKVARINLNLADKEHPIIKAVLQYESPETDATWWDGFTIVAKPDLSEIDRIYLGLEYGPSKRLMLFHGAPHTFHYEPNRDEYTVYPLGDPGTQCRVALYVK